MSHPEGESLKVGFDGCLKLEFHGSKVTSDAGLLAYRDLDEALGLFDSSPTVFHDPRTGRNVQHDITSLLRQSIYSRLAGYEDVNDAQRLSVDPAMRSVTGKKVERNAASPNTVGRFETEMPARTENLDSLADLNGQWVKLIKIGAKVVRSGRYTTFQMAKVVVSKGVFTEILARIGRLRCCPASFSSEN